MVVTEHVLVEKKRVKIFIDNQFAFWVYQRDFRKYPILENFQPGQEVGENLLQAVWKEIVWLRAKEAALSLLDYRDRSELEIRKKLEEKEFPKEILDYVVADLYEYHYLDEQRLVRSYLIGNAKSKSKRMILLKLKEKGISEEIIKNVMESESYQGNTAAFYALEKKLKDKRIEQLSWNEKQKINAFLYRKGFTRDEISYAWRTIDQI